MLGRKNRSCSKKNEMKKKREKNYMGFYLVAHQTHAQPAPCSAAPTLIFRSFPHSRSGSVPGIGAAPPRRRPATEGQSQARRRRRRRLPLPPLASRLRPPRTVRRPCVRTSLSPPASALPWEPGQLPRVAGPWLRR